MAYDTINSLYAKCASVVKGYISLSCSLEAIKPIMLVKTKVM